LNNIFKKVLIFKNLIKSTEEYDCHEFLSLDSSLNIEINDTQSESGYVSSPSSSSESRLTIKKVKLVIMSIFIRVKLKSTQNLVKTTQNEIKNTHEQN
jgi:hypothetical protein